ncbi:MAG: hypothetical protein A3F83_09190 [Candidatus Glassbacteria bacterium RIFCSPLOWO2_12_FULL_58_11]|uniref:Molybdopterin oxidoreductase n=1 Tax=Candidatus Glassbacteria bacterium RIFCSPLOWO2_12_FULL_58_11 TaxID=1817867 RepID=A0A1F5YTJ5_9BACT|nr:MAG: hypothetical protein A3F83_09190 [Candidatus Glassbacteria bacterium RIFCSPLOWO2_12_FULL_58_11]
MHEQETVRLSDPGPLKVGRKPEIVLAALAALGLIVFLAGLAIDPTRAWYNFLIDYFFFLAIGVAGIVLTAIHYATDSTWSVTVRRVAEGLSAYLPVSLVLSLALIICIPVLYQWAVPTHVHLWHEKHIYLNRTFVIGRQLLCYGIWIWIGMGLVRRSVKQDISGDVALYRRNRTMGPVFLLLFALTITFTSFDLLMSLEESWYSTIFPVYIFSGLFLSGYATTSILVVYLRRAGYLREAVKDYHLRDMATWMMAFSVFMIYIGFSQYMLIWYANLPVEIGYMMKRSAGGWGYIFILLPLLKWIIPFVVLMPDRCRKSETVIVLVSLAVLLGQWLDLYWIVAPVFSERLVLVSWMEIGVFLGFAGLFGLSVLRFYKKHSLVAVNDPKLDECLKGRYLHV